MICAHDLQPAANGDIGQSRLAWFAEVKGCDLQPSTFEQKRHLPEAAAPVERMTVRQLPGKVVGDPYVVPDAYGLVEMREGFKTQRPASMSAD